MAPTITLFFLNASRSIRIAFLLEGLNLPYTLISANRAPNGLAPPDFKARIRAAGQPLGKSPTLVDGDLVIAESGAIVEYLLETYDKDHKLMPPPEDAAGRAKVREWVHAAEGGFMMPAMPVLYTRWQIPEDVPERDQLLAVVEQKLSVNVHNSFDWLEGELKAQKAKGSGWLVGKALTAADITLQFSVQFIMERKLGVGGRGEGKWPEVVAWLERIEAVEVYQKAVNKTGFSLEGNFRK